PLPVDEACGVAGTIAAALEAAHARGIVHRDLKCANVKLPPQGGVKLLDFGLAKVVAEGGPAGDSRPTTPHRLTVEGAVVGTPAYMSPEQARGQEVDARTDIWAFGCLLYEMLTGRPAFGGTTPSDTIGAVLTRDPEWRALPSRTPPGVRRTLRRCLQR